MSVIGVDPYLLTLFLFLAELVENPEQIQNIAPIIIREIHYRLLIGKVGNQFNKFYTTGTKSNKIAQVIHWMRNNSHEPFDIEKLANMAHMARSTFHRSFKEATTISPLKFYKWLWFV